MYDIENKLHIHINHKIACCVLYEKPWDHWPTCSFFIKRRSESPGLGKVLVQHAPFLRMYADYIRNFDQAMELVRTWTERSSAFRNIIQDIQVYITHSTRHRLFLSSCRVWSQHYMHVCPGLESGGMWQPHSAASHVGASPEGSTLWDAAKGLPEQAASGKPRLWTCSE